MAIPVLEVWRSVLHLSFHEILQGRGQSQSMGVRVYRRRAVG